MIRLRQICLVAHELAPAVEDLSEVLGLATCHHDPAVGKYGLENALLPVVTASGYEFGRLLAGTVIIESIFLIPGMGRYLIDAVFQRDYSAIQGIMVVIAVAILTVNVILALVYAWLNPRIRYT